MPKKAEDLISELAPPVSVQPERVAEKTYLQATQILQKAALLLRPFPPAEDLVVAVATLPERDPYIELLPIYVVRTASIPADCLGRAAVRGCQYAWNPRDTGGGDACGKCLSVPWLIKAKSEPNGRRGAPGCSVGIRESEGNRVCIRIRTHNVFSRPLD